MTRIPPHAKEIECYILGAIMMESRCFETVSDILTTDCFYLDSNKAIYGAMCDMAANGKQIDFLTVIEELRASGRLNTVGGALEVSKLTNNFTSAVGIDGKCRIVLEKYIKREVGRITAEINTLSFDDGGDAFELLDKVEQDIFAIANKHLNGDYTALDKGLVATLQNIEARRNQSHHITGVPTGYQKLDSLTHGWQPTDLIILAARPSVGKTAFALNLALNAALSEVKKTNVGFFSLEMSVGQLVERVISRQSEVFLDSIRSGKLNDHWMKQIYDRGVMSLDKAKIFIDDCASLNMLQLRSKARRMVKKDGVGLIIIDYLQLMTGDRNKGGNREQEISQISRDLKKLAKELQIPVIALSQLSRKLEDRAAKVPQLSDLRESGAIEQDADMVAFLYIPETEDNKREEGLLLIRKHRNGSLDEIPFEINHSIQKWSEKSGWVPVDGF